MVEEQYNGFKIVSDGRFCMKAIKPIGKGSVPMGLRGLYTNSDMAKRAIDLHVKEKKVESDGKTKQRTGE